jgi:hypothetical protein
MAGSPKYPNYARALEGTAPAVAGILMGFDSALFAAVAVAADNVSLVTSPIEWHLIPFYERSVVSLPLESRYVIMMLAAASALLFYGAIISSLYAQMSNISGTVFEHVQLDTLTKRDWVDRHSKYLKKTLWRFNGALLLLGAALSVFAPASIRAFCAYLLIAYVCYAWFVGED